jgi:predicted RNase H-like HicB family nuclease
MRHAGIIEKALGSYSAHVPDPLCCVATGDIVAEVEAEIRDAIRFHIDGLRENGLPVPEATTVAAEVEA